jgi:ribosomal protein S18 acetylase RimI-like enzyme
MAGVVLETFFRNRFRLPGFFGYLKWLSFVEKKHPQRPHYYVDFFGVAPWRQNRGLGSAILDFITRKADQEHCGCYLESTNPRNLPLYQRFGFQVLGMGQVVVPTWFFWRDPKS